MGSSTNSYFGYCLQKKDMCGYCQEQPCGWVELNLKKTIYVQCLQITQKTY